MELGLGMNGRSLIPGSSDIWSDVPGHHKSWSQTIVAMKDCEGKRRKMESCVEGKERLRL